MGALDKYRSPWSAEGGVVTVHGAFERGLRETRPDGKSQGETSWGFKVAVSPQCPPRPCTPLRVGSIINTVPQASCSPRLALALPREGKLRPREKMHLGRVSRQRMWPSSAFPYPSPHCLGSCVPDSQAQLSRALQACARDAGRKGRTLPIPWNPHHRTLFPFRTTTTLWP